MGSKYDGLNTRGRKAVAGDRSGVLLPHIIAIRDAGGKLTKTLDAGEGIKRISFCPKTGSGKRITIEVGPGDRVRVGKIRRMLERAATAG